MKPRVRPKPDALLARQAVLAARALPQGAVVPAEAVRGKRWTALVDGWYPKTSLYSLNARQHWGSRKRLQDDAAERTGNALKCAYWPCIHYGSRWAVTLTVQQRLGRRPDGDNLQGSLKHVRDSVAKYLGVDDGDAGVEWRYEWQRGPDGVLMALEEVA